MTISSDPGMWVGVLFIVAAYSIIIKDSPLYRFAERTVVGVTAGVLTAQGIDNIRKLAWMPLMDGAVVNIIPILIGLLMFTRISKKYSYLSRYPIVLMLGSGIAAGMVRSIPAEIITQTTGLFTSIPSGATLLNILDLIIVPLFAATTLLFFTYTREHTGGLGILTKIGRYAMMFGLGANFGNMVATRTSYVIQPLQTVLYQWLGIRI